MIPCGGAKVNRIAGFFGAWRGVFAGACPSAPPVWWVCRSGAQGVAYFLCRPPTLPLVCLIAPIPPPALAERSSPPGKGETFSFLMQGASPLASPGLNPSGTYSPSKTGAQRKACPCVAGAESVSGVQGMACFLCRRLAPAVSLPFCPLSPRPPSPPGKGGIFSFLMQGASPLASPGLNLWFAAKPKERGSLRVVPPGYSRRTPAWQGL